MGWERETKLVCVVGTEPASSHEPRAATQDVLVRAGLGRRPIVVLCSFSSCGVTLKIVEPCRVAVHTCVCVCGCVVDMRVCMYV